MRQITPAVRTADILGRLDVRRTALVLFGAIAVIGVLGIAIRIIDPGNVWLDLDAELRLKWPRGASTVALPALWSSLLFGLAGIGWLAWARVSRSDRASWAGLGLGLTMLFFAVDELFVVHERLQYRTGVDWWILYFPIAAGMFALLGLLAWRFRNSERSASLMLAGTGICWLAALALELVQTRGGEKVELYSLFMIPEELLELVGTSLCALAAIVLLHAAVASRGGASGAVDDGQ